MKRLFSVLAVAVFTASLSSVAFAGNDLWKKCASCHGADGKGETKMGKKLGLRDLSKAEVQASFTDEDIVKVIKEGKKDKDGKVLKKGFAGKFSDDEIKELVKLTRALKK